MYTLLIWIKCILLLLLTISANAQNEAKIWYWGNGHGLDFHYTPPKLLNDGAIYTQEGSSSICDADGNLLFYTDGVTVWNREHQPMPNGTGLRGHWSSIQGAMIVRKPESEHLYYIFTNGEGQSTRYYSVVDMRKENGLGDVVEKNVFKFYDALELQNSVLHANGSDVWVFCFLVPNLLVATLETSNGVTQVVITTPKNCYAQNQLGGQIAVSPNGKHIALSVTDHSQSSQVTQFRHPIYIFRFDNNTGETQFLTEIHTYGMPRVTTLSFSADSKYLYWTHGSNTNVMKHLVNRVKVTEAGISDIERSPLDLFFNTGCKSDTSKGILQRFFFSLQLAVDGNIYFIQRCDCMDCPDELKQEFYIGRIEHSNDSFLVNTAMFPLETRPAPQYTPHQSGGVTFNGYSLPLLLQNFFDPFFQASLGSDTVVCSDQPVELRYYPGASVLWSTGDTTEVLVVTRPGTYSVIASHPDNPGWIRHDTIHVAHKPCTGRCNEVVVSPNPNTGRFTIEVEKPVAGKLELYTNSGQLVASESLPTDHPNPYPIHATLSPGNYLLRYSNETCSETVRVVVMKR